MLYTLLNNRQANPNRCVMLGWKVIFLLNGSRCGALVWSFACYLSIWYASTGTNLRSHPTARNEAIGTQSVEKKYVPASVQCWRWVEWLCRERNEKQRSTIITQSTNPTMRIKHINFPCTHNDRSGLFYRFCTGGSQAITAFSLLINYRHFSALYSSHLLIVIVTYLRTSPASETNNFITIWLPSLPPSAILLFCSLAENPTRAEELKNVDRLASDARFLLLLLPNCTQKRFWRVVSVPAEPRTVLDFALVEHQNERKQKISRHRSGRTFSTKQMNAAEK